jgi:hypothetical protein
VALNSRRIGTDATLPLLAVPYKAYDLPQCEVRNRSFSLIRLSFVAVLVAGHQQEFGIATKFRPFFDLRLSGHGQIRVCVDLCLASHSFTVEFGRYCMRMFKAVRGSLFTQLQVDTAPKRIYVAI